MFGRDVDLAVMAHAMAEWPRECCGAVTPSGYVRLENLSAEPESTFDCDAQVADMLARGVEVLALAHSHPIERDSLFRPRTVGVEGDFRGPSAHDMRQQVAMDIPWGIVATDGVNCLPMMWWGPGVPVPPLQGRDFRHGPSGSDGKGDCYALLRDYYATEHGVALPEVPRDDIWWLDGLSLYEDFLEPAGFVPTTDPQPGDGALMQIMSPVANHAGVLLPGGLLLHHPAGRLSGTHPVRAFQKHSLRWFRNIHVRP